jgi:hypothetical protein
LRGVMAATQLDLLGCHRSVLPPIVDVCTRDKVSVNVRSGPQAHSEAMDVCA